MISEYRTIHNLLLNSIFYLNRMQDQILFIFKIKKKNLSMFVKFDKVCCLISIGFRDFKKINRFLMFAFKVKMSLFYCNAL